MKSIKVKLFLGITFILSIFIVGILIYGVTFKNFFINSKLNEMSNAIEEIELGFASNENSIEQLIGNISDKYNLQIEITDSDSGTLLYGSTMHGNGMMGRNRFFIEEFLGAKDGIERVIVQDRSTSVKFITATKETSDYYFVIKTPISAIEDSVDKSMKLIFIIICPITILILLITLHYAKVFTKPIIEITKKTSKIESLDFTKNLVITSNDEIGDLAKSVNSLSHKIEKSLTELRDKNEKLQKLIDNEKQNDILNKEFVSSVSHELKSPIAVISGYIQGLKSGIVKSEEDKVYYLEVIEEEAERMQIIVNDLLDLYKLESTTFKINEKTVNLDKLVSRILDKLEFRFNEQNIQLTSKIDKCTVIGDEVRLEQAIVNYINNALSHVDNRNEIKINVMNSGGKITLSVFNSGKNIEPENLEKIWRGFVRVDKVRNYREKRVGLGLAIVDQIVRLHCGERGIINRQDGVEFWIKLDECN